jgi:hypothetical protein
LPSDPIDLPDELRLTQYGEQPPFGDGFRDRLREDIGETELSMILGEVDASAAAVLVTRYLAAGAAQRHQGEPAARECLSAAHRSGRACCMG